MFINTAQTKLLRLPGSFECLLALGFRVVSPCCLSVATIAGLKDGSVSLDAMESFSLAETMRDNRWQMNLSEPDPEKDTQLWIAWFDGLTAKRDALARARP